MAFVPGTEIDKPAVDLSEAENPFAKVRTVSRALRKSGVPENIIIQFCGLAASGDQMFGDLESTIADYVEVS